MFNKTTKYKQSIESSYIIPTVTGYKNLLFPRNSSWRSKFESDRRLQRGTNILPPKLNKCSTVTLDGRAVLNCRNCCFTFGYFTSVNSSLQGSFKNESTSLFTVSQVLFVSCKNSKKSSSCDWDSHACKQYSGVDGGGATFVNFCNSQYCCCVQNCNE